MLNETSLDTLCGALAYAMGIESPAHAAAPNEDLTAYVDAKLEGRKADRIFLYNPDAIARWIYEKFPNLLSDVLDATELELPFHSVFPPKTPVCFGTFYTGAQPEVHGIQKYEKPVIRIDTLFDALIRAGKKPIIIATNNCSLAMIFLERQMDYIITDSIEEANAAAARVIMEDKHDFVVLYNGNYDSCVHKAGPDSYESLAELRLNNHVFAMFNRLVQNHWQHHDTLVGFAMDHGCHWIEKVDPETGETIRKGSHSKDIPEDMQIVHRYVIHPAK